LGLSLPPLAGAKLRKLCRNGIPYLWGFKAEKRREE